MKKNNNSGFTLVELVVVIALLSVMMGAILQLMDPISNIYKDTLDTVNTKTSGETMISYIEDKTRYSTNMLVLKNYVGVPQINKIASTQSATVGGCSIDFTDVIVIDNHNLRSYALNDYKGDTGSVATRKNCTGTLYSIGKIGSADVLDFKNANTGTLGDDIYGDYTYDFDLDVKIADSTHSMLKLNVDTYKMEYDGSSYVRNTDPEYTAERYFDLVNINLGNASYNIYGIIDFDNAPDYTKYPQVTSAPSGLTAQQQSLFNTADADNKFTYIFYKVNKTNEALNYTVTFQYGDVDTNPAILRGSVYGSPVKLEAGTKFPSSKIPSPSIPTGYSGFRFTDGVDTVDLTDLVVTSDMLINIELIKDANFFEHTVKFYDTLASAWLTDSQVPNGSASTAEAYAPSPTYDTEKQYYEWLEQGTNKKITEVYCYSTTTTPNTYYFYSKIYDKCKVEFKDNGTVVDTQYIMPGNKAAAPTYVPTAPEGKVFDGWFSNGTALNNLDITDNPTVFEPQFSDIPPSGASMVLLQGKGNFSVDNYVWDATIGDNRVDQFLTIVVELKNVGTGNSNASEVFKVKVVTNEKIDSYTIPDNYKSNVKKITKKDDYTLEIELTNIETDPTKHWEWSKYLEPVKIKSTVTATQGGTKTFSATDVSLI